MKNLLLLLKPANILASLVNILVLALAVSLIAFHRLPNDVPLWFSKPWGETRLTSANSLWLLPALMGTFFLMGHALAKLVGKDHKILADIVSWSTAFISLVFLLSLYKIILIVI